MGRAPCCDKANVKRGPWSPEEDATLKSYVESHGTGGNWIALPRKAGLRRCGKSCRLRWLNYLRPDIKHGGFTEEEDNIICGLYLQMGSRWSVIASQLPGRTDNDVKNYWNTKLRKKMIAGKINLTTSNSSSQSTHINHATALPASSTSIVSPCFPKTETHDSAFPNLQTQNSAVSHLTDNINHGYSQMASFNPYLCNPRFMDFSEFGTSTATSNNSPINVNYSSSQEGSSISDSPAKGDHKHCTESMQPGGGNVCEEDAGILMEFGFGLPYYDIVNGIPYEEKTSEIACTSLADCTSVSSIIPHGLNQSVMNYY